MYKKKNKLGGPLPFAMFLFAMSLAPSLVWAGDGHSSRITDEPIPLLIEGMPQRPRPPIELGEPFLGTGTLGPGFQLPTGAVWQPSLLLFGSWRTSFQSHPGATDDARIDEWANRLNLFANLQLSGSERIVVGFRNLDHNGNFSGYVFDAQNAGIEEGSVEEFDADLDSFFFEGDLGEIFPGLSLDDFKSTDFGFAVGRQPMFFQEGLLINDVVDGIGFTRTALQPKNTSNYRSTLFWGWDRVNPGGLTENPARLLAWLNSIDSRRVTIDFDVAHVLESPESGRDDLTVAGIGLIGRRGSLNCAVRFLSSLSSDESREGSLLFGEFSYTPHRSHNLAYATAFIAANSYQSASSSRGGGPLGRVGVNFAGVGVGNYGSPLPGGTSDVAGGALGYQMFFHHNRRQLLLEVATRQGLEEYVLDSHAFTARYQMAMGKHVVLVHDAFVADLEGNEDLGVGGRFELLLKF